MSEQTFPWPTVVFTDATGERCVAHYFYGPRSGLPIGIIQGPGRTNVISVNFKSIDVVGVRHATYLGAANVREMLRSEPRCGRCAQPGHNRRTCGAHSAGGVS